MNKFFYPFLAFLLCISFQNVFSQQTGTFNDTIMFNGESRYVSYYVPTDYSSTTPHNLFVSLHGLGDNADNLRNVLIQGGWQTGLPTNTILVFIDGGEDPNSDHLAPEGDEDFIFAAIDEAINEYNIDESEIILHGFSLGGRSALKIGLDFPELFKGLYLSTPAIQGYNDLINNEDSGQPIYAYENASQIPIVITVGNEDQSYLRQDIGLLMELVKNNGIVDLFPFNGGHSMVGPQSTPTFLAFINEPAVGNTNLQILNDDGKRGYICKSTDMGPFLIRNAGAETINELKYTVSVAGQEQAELTISEPMGSFESAFLDVPEFDISSFIGSQSVTIQITEINGSPVASTQGNTRQFNRNFSPEGIQADIFSSSMSPNDNIGWSKQINFYPFDWFDEEDPSGKNMLLAFNHVFLFDGQGHSHTLLSPVVDVAELEEKELNITYSSTYLTYQTENGNFTFSDTLSISYSTDCGDSWTELTSSTEGDLATYGPLLNSPNLNDLLTYPAPSTYEVKSIDLSSLQNENTVQFKLDYTSGLGGVLWLDHITIGKIPSSVEFASSKSIYPNPTEGIFNIENTESIDLIEVVDPSGKTVNSFSNYQSGDLNITELPSGNYMIIGKSDKGVKFSQPLIKR
ncbi:MAG: hypothetical protein Kapaf2KO_18970 [Candidatus Kapaibacteriales bacterium]